MARCLGCTRAVLKTALLPGAVLQLLECRVSREAAACSSISRQVGLAIPMRHAGSLVHGS